MKRKERLKTPSAGHRAKPLIVASRQAHFARQNSSQVFLFDNKSKQGPHINGIFSKPLPEPSTLPLAAIGSDCG
jgi:hypothetical protein